jgi:hypothetical protein
MEFRKLQCEHSNRRNFRSTSALIRKSSPSSCKQSKQMEDNMAKRDIVDVKARDTIPGSGLGCVFNQEAWGAAKAVERYGGGTRTPDMRPPEANKPQKLGCANNLQGPNYANDTPNDWRRGAGGSAEGKPNFDPGYKGKR